MHPDDLELELLRTGEETGASAAHLRTCAECQSRLTALTALAESLLDPAAQPGVPPGGLRPGVEQAILNGARQGARAVQRRKRAGRALRWALPLPAAAALLFLLVRPAGEPAPAPASSADVNRDGRVDVLDAFLLARALDQGTAPAWGDVDGDGRVDASDVDAVARRAVRIQGGG